MSSITVILAIAFCADTSGVIRDICINPDTSGVIPDISINPDIPDIFINPPNVFWFWNHHRKLHYICNQLTCGITLILHKQILSLDFTLLLLVVCCCNRHKRNPEALRTKCILCIVQEFYLCKGIYFDLHIIFTTCHVDG